MTKKVLFIVSCAQEIGPNNCKIGNYLQEVSHPYHEFVEQGCQVDFASTEGGEAPIDGLELTDDPSECDFPQR